MAQTIQSYCLLVLKAGSLKLRCWQGWFLLRWLSLAWRWLSPPVFSHDLLCMCLLITTVKLDESPPWPNIIIFLRILSPDTHTIWSNGAWVGFKHMNFRLVRNLTHNVTLGKSLVPSVSFLIFKIDVKVKVESTNLYGPSQLWFFQLRISSTSLGPLVILFFKFPLGDTVLIL